MLYVHISILLVAIYLAYRKRIRARQLLWLVIAVVIAILHLRNMQPEQAIFERGDFGEEDAVETVYIGVGEEREFVQTHDIVIPAMKYTKGELEALSKQAAKQLGEWILGNNASLDEIVSDVFLPESIAGFPFEIAWLSSDVELITEEGHVLNEYLKEAKICILTAEFSCQEEVYEASFTLTVQPAHFTHQQLEEKRIQELLENCVDEQLNQNIIEIPEQMGTYWIYKALPDEKLTLLWPGIVAFIIVYGYAHKREEERQREKKWRESLIQAYPYFVNHLVLYLGAGMPVKGAMEQMRKQMLQSEKSQHQVLCTELNNMFYEMESGISEKQAYQQLAKRLVNCGYSKIMTLMIQTLTLGSKGLLDRLEELELEAFVKWKESEKARGETASTKLLLPMVILLGVTMLLIVVPGFWGMS